MNKDAIKTGADPGNQFAEGAAVMISKQFSKPI
jgi:hypothetical protein